MKLNPFTRELIRNALVTVADNMIVAVVRSSRSLVVKSNMDFSSAVFDATGEMVAQGLALPAHLGAFMPALKGCLAYFGDDIAPGDILANNDPYAGASHLNDIFMFRPIYAANGERIAFAGLILHHTDMGGRVPGGNASDSTEIYQEGLRIPPSKIYVADKPNETLIRIIEHNVRVPNKVMGDVRAQMAALRAADAELRKVLDEYDVGAFKAYMADLIAYTERLTRAGIAALPDGEAEFDDWNDDDGTGAGPVRFHVKVTIKGDELTVDFTGTSEQTSGALNPNIWFTGSCTYAVLRTVLPRHMPNNAGFYKPITIIAPEGTFVNPRFPAPLGARGQAGHRVRSVVLGALAKLIPERIPACPGGSEFAIVFAGYEKDTRRPYLLLEFHNTTGHGGGPNRDGQEAGPYFSGNLANVSVELIEAENPVLLEEYAFLPDTGGPGEYRGALGIVRQYRALAEESLVQVRSDRQTTGPFGLFGGGAGARGRCIMNPHIGGGEVVASKFILNMKKGQVFRGEMPGSGGYGDPYAREPARVLEDFRQNKVTPAHALATYGVVIDPETGKLDLAATQARRAEVAGATS